MKACFESMWHSQLHTHIVDATIDQQQTVWNTLYNWLEHFLLNVHIVKNKKTRIVHNIIVV